MHIDEQVGLLEKHSIFQGLDRENLMLLAFSAERLVFNRGEEIVRAGRVGDAAFLILSGSARVMDAAKYESAENLLYRGALIGELAMLVEFTTSRSVLAREETVVLEFSRRLIHEFMAQASAIRAHFPAKIQSRLMGLAGEMRRFDETLETLKPTG